MYERTMALSRWARLALLGALMTVMPGTVCALGLGKLTVHSALNERLDAEIPFTSVSKRELKTLAVSLNPKPHLSGSQIETPAWSGPIGVQLQEHPDGRHSLQLRSKHVIREPYLRLVVQVEWAGGRLIREFTALINPRDLLSDVASAAVPAESEPSSEHLISQAPQQSAPLIEEPSPARANPGANLKIERLESTQGPSALEPASSAAVEKTSDEKTNTGDSRSATLSFKEKELSERIRVLESQITTLSGLLKLKSEILSRAQQPNQQTTSQATDVESPVPTSPSISEMPTRGEAARQEQVSESTGLTTKAREHNRASQRTGPALEQERMFSIRQVLMVATVLIGGLLVVGGIAMTLVKRRNKPRALIQAEENQALTTQVGPATDGTPTIHDRRSGRGRRRRFVPVPFERRRGPRRQQDNIATHIGQLHAEGVDTVEETETYIACGHHDHAEEALKDAISKNPDRHALKVKLLALYHQRQHIAEFESLANKLYAALEPGVPLEHKEGTQDADDIRGQDVEPSSKEHDVEPSEPLFLGLNESTDKEEEAGQELEPFSADLSTDENRLLEHDIEALGMDVPKTEDESTQQIVGDLAAGEKKKPDESREDKETTDRGLEVLEIEDLADIRQAVEQGLAVIESNEPGDDSKLADTKATKKKKTAVPRSRKNIRKTKAPQEADSQAQENKQEQWRNPATKIDLAKAYIEMGDAERARHLLDEVLESWQPGDGTEG